MSSSFVSCFKTRNCKCTTISTGDPNPYGTQAGTYISNHPISGDPLEGGGSKKSQKAQCKSNEYSDEYSKSTCELSK